MDDTATNRLEPQGVGFLRGGPLAARTVAVLALRLRGAVEAGRGATMRTARALGGAGQALPAPPKAGHSALLSRGHAAVGEARAGVNCARG